jgi:hypothetical protein
MTLLPPTEQAIDSPANALRAEDAAWLRRRIALVRSDLDDLVKSIYWTDGLGRSCDHLKEAIAQLKAARDASHHTRP